MKDRTIFATVSLHISAALYVLLGLLICAIPILVGNDREFRDEFLWVFFVIIGGLCVGMAIVAEVVAHGLRQRKYWGWVAGLVLFGLYLPSAFCPLGAIGLWALISTGTQAAFADRPAGTPYPARNW